MQKLTYPEPKNEEDAARVRLLADLGVTVEARFVPYSQSDEGKARTDNPTPSHPPKLCWEVSILRNGRTLFCCDYSAGVAHAPSYKQSHKFTVDEWREIVDECEIGKRRISKGNAAIWPNPVDVFACILMDSSAIDHRSFEEWASDYGYDTDSRKAESIYRVCIDRGLKLRAALGDEALTKLREAFENW